MSVNRGTFLFLLAVALANAEFRCYKCRMSPKCNEPYGHPTIPCETNLCVTFSATFKGVTYTDRGCDKNNACDTWKEMVRGHKTTQKCCSSTLCNGKSQILADQLSPRRPGFLPDIGITENTRSPLPGSERGTKSTTNENLDFYANTPSPQRDVQSASCQVGPRIGILLYSVIWFLIRP